MTDNSCAVSDRICERQAPNDRPKELREKLAKLDASFTPLTHAMTVAVDTKAPKAYIALGGDYRSKGAEVTPGLPAVLTSAPFKDRLSFARWLVRTRESADGARRGQPHLAGVLRPRHRPHIGRFRHAGRKADASRTARLARSGVSWTAAGA